MSDKTVLQLRGEIISARNFEGKSLFITYCFILPSDWECNDDSKLCASTICSRVTKNNEKHEIAYFNQLFDFSINVPRNSTPDHASLVMEVTSVDWWERYCCEGYGMLKLALNSGRSYVSVPTWRPIPSTNQGRRLENMRRFFVGGSSQLNDLGIPLADTKNKTVLSRAGLCAASSGEVQLSLDVGWQTGVPRSVHSRHHRFRTSDVLVTSVDQVIQSFLQVQSRMQQVRDNIRANFDVS